MPDNNLDCVDGLFTLWFVRCSLLYCNGERNLNKDTFHIQYVKFLQNKLQRNKIRVYKIDTTSVVVIIFPKKTILGKLNLKTVEYVVTNQSQY